MDKPACLKLSTNSHAPFPFEHELVHNLAQLLIMYYHWYMYYQNHISCCPLTTLFLLKIKHINGRTMWDNITHGKTSTSDATVSPVTYFNLFGPSNNISFHTTNDIPLEMLKKYGQTFRSQGREEERKGREINYRTTRQPFQHALRCKASQVSDADGALPHQLQHCLTHHIPHPQIAWRQPKINSPWDKDSYILQLNVCLSVCLGKLSLSNFIW